MGLELATWHSPWHWNSFPAPDLAFRGAHRHVPMTRDLAHWDVIEALEEVCVYKVFEVYGVTDHHDKHRLKVQAIVGEVDKIYCQVE